MWGRALKGQAAANLVRHLLTNKGRPLEDEDFTEAKEQAKRGARNKPPASLM